MPAVDPSPSPETTATACRQHLRAVQRWRRGGPSPVIQSHTAAATIKTGTVTGNSVRRFSGSDNQCKTDGKNSISVIFSTISSKHRLQLPGLLRMIYQPSRTKEPEQKCCEDKGQWFAGCILFNLRIESSEDVDLLHHDTALRSIGNKS
nr:hypothetical protein Itr_chr07CG09510 [Ipomoea trifida]